MKKNLRQDMWSTGVLILLCCSSLVRTQDMFSGASDIKLLTGNFASFGVGALLGIILKKCPDCPVESTPSMVCPEAFISKIVGDDMRCYRLVPAADVGKEDAIRMCASFAPDGQLLEIEADQEFQAVSDFLDDQTSSVSAWVGATDYALDGDYIWDSGYIVTQTVADNDPWSTTDVCVQIDTTNKTLKSSECTVTGPYICESSLVQNP